MSNSTETMVLQQLVHENSRKKGLAQQQVASVFMQTSGRVQKLRQSFSRFSKQVNDLHQNKAKERLIKLVNQLRQLVDSDESIFSHQGSSLFDVLRQKSSDCGCTADVVASVYYMQALLEAIKLNYVIAAQCCNWAAAVVGLTTEVVLHYKKERAEFLLCQGSDFSDMGALVDAVRLLEDELLTHLSADQQPQQWSATQQLLGNTLARLAQWQRGTSNLENAINAFNAALSKQDRQQQPLEWAQTQNNMGNALGLLGYRRGDQQLLSDAAEAFELALQVQSEQQVQQQKASTQNNLAAVLQSLGERNKDAKMLKKAVQAYKEVLIIWTREYYPQHWSTTMDNLGTALRLLGGYRKGPRTLEQSVAAYNSALAERPRQQYPQQWAMTQNNHGAALYQLGERQQNTQIIERAIGAYEQALREWTVESAPIKWGMTLANLAVARRTLAQMTANINQAKKAVAELQDVCEVFRKASHAQYSELGIDQLAQTRKVVEVLSAQKAAETE